LNVHGCLVKSFQNEKWILWFSNSFVGSMYECNVNPLHIFITKSCTKNPPSWSILHLQSPYYALWNMLCITMLVPTTIIIYKHTSQMKKTTLMVHHFQTKMWLTKKQGSKPKTQNGKQNTKNNMCSRISNHQKWFENPQLGIMSLKLNNLNPIHTWTNSNF
jgi:hypothetical protein